MFKGVPDASYAMLQHAQRDPNPYIAFTTPLFCRPGILSPLFPVPGVRGTLRRALPDEPIQMSRHHRGEAIRKLLIRRPKRRGS
jgi:hypothetical protein